MTGADILWSTLTRAGLEICFVNFGTTEVPLVAALDRSLGMRAVPALFEGVCTGAADGYARMTGKPACTLLHLGLGLSNGLANLHNAKRAHSPVVNIVGQHATWHLPCDSPETTDIPALAGTVAGWAKTTRAPEAVSEDAAEAVFAARQGQVSVLIVPEDHQWSECPELLHDVAPRSDDSPDERLLREAAKVLRVGASTVLLLGKKALSRRGIAAATRIRAATGCSLLAETFAARIEQGGDTPTVTRLAYLPEDATKQLSGRHAVVLAGTRDPVATFGYKGGRSRLLSDEQTSMAMVENGQDVEEALEILAEMLGAPAGFPASTTMETRLVPAVGPLTIASFGRTLAALLPEQAIIVEEAITSAGAYYDQSGPLPPHTVLTLTGGAIGQGIPCATGAALACPDRPVISIEGDGSAMYTCQALWTQAREKLNVTTLICSNQSYDILKLEMFRAGQTLRRHDVAMLTDLGSPPIDWVHLSHGLGVPAARTTTSEDFAREFNLALREPGPHLIEVVLSHKG